ncbi:MAG: hypothetical protein AAGA96_14470 [Verrucomicrobiota bacterium]
MRTSFDQFARLGKGLFGMSSLWMGDDHLVYVRGSGILMPFTEEYKRYRYRDIQTISLARTSRIGGSILYTMGLLFIAGMIALVFGLSADNGINLPTAVLLSFLFVTALLLTAGLLRHLVLGPTCVCDIQTSLSRDRIRPLSRYLSATQAIEQIEKKIRESQEALFEQSNDSSGSLDARPAITLQVEHFQIPKPVLFNFACFGFLGLLCAVALHLENIALTAIVIVAMLGQSLLLTLSLIASARKATPESIRTVLWIQLGFFFVFIGVAVVYFLIVATREPTYTVGITGPLEAYTAIAAEWGGIGYGVFLTIAFGMLATGLSGVILGANWAKRIRQVKQLESEGNAEGEANSNG